MFQVEDHLEVFDGELCVGGVSTVDLADIYGTPLFVVNEQRVRENYRAYRDAFPEADIYYAAKANGNLSVLRILATEGAGADVFSAGELYLALMAGIPRKKVLFNGNSKSTGDLDMALDAGVRISVDSIGELENLAEVRGDRVAEIAFRVNPDVSPETHPKIATGLRTSKFGIPHEEVVSAYQRAIDLGITPVGIHCHIGSQILDLSPFEEMIHRMMDLVEELHDIGIDLEFVDVGSGLGIPYEKQKEAPTPRDLADTIVPIFEKRCREISVSPHLVLEPGRYIVGDASILLTRVNTVKPAAKNFVAVDAGFNVLIRPAMYDSYHHVVVANKAAEEPVEEYDVVGPICETGDILARDRMLPRVERDDLVAILDAGAYGYSMSSQYNGRPRPPEILVNNGEVDLVRKGEEVEDLLLGQEIPARLL